MLAVAVATAAVAIAVSARAFDTSTLTMGGSLPLADLRPLIAQAPQLAGEIEAAAAAVGKPADDIICGGQRFSNRWTHLGGARVSPYICMFADKRFLEIRATVRLEDRRGKVFDKPTKEAMQRASRIVETRPTWTWRSDDPR